MRNQGPGDDVVLLLFLAYVKLKVDMKKRQRTSRNGYSKLFVVFILFLLLTAAFIFTLPASTKPRDAYIVSAISGSRPIMSYLYLRDGNFDNFSCNYKDMIALCEEIDANYGLNDGAEPVIAHDAANDAQAACIYSPLNVKRKTTSYWYCADSEGYVGYTSIHPGSPGYCVDGKNAVCPPLLTDIP